MFNTLFTLLIVGLSLWIAVNCVRLIRLSGGNKSDDAALAKVWRRWLMLVFGALAATALIVVTYASLPLPPMYTHVAHPETGYAFPAITDIASIKVVKWRPHGQAGPVEFQVPEQCWGEILAALTPSESDSQPCKWMSLAELDLQIKGGGSYFIGLFRLPSEPVGAFSAGPSFEERKYYRGGDSTQLENALARAHAEFTKKNTQHDAGP